MAGLPKAVQPAGVCSWKGSVAGAASSWEGSPPTPKRICFLTPRSAQLQSIPWHAVVAALQLWLGVALPLALVLAGQARRYQRFRRERHAAMWATCQPGNTLEGSTEWQYELLRQAVQQLRATSWVLRGLLLVGLTELAALHSLLLHAPKDCPACAACGGATQSCCPAR